MAHSLPEFETKDVLGKTKHYAASVGLVSALVPSVSAEKISNVLVRNPNTNAINEILYVAFDGGSTYLSLGRGEFAAWSPKTNGAGVPVTQITLLGSSAAVDYEVVMDFEP